MELLIFSDSHGNPTGMRSALERQPRQPHAICFLGDGLQDLERISCGSALLYAVRGNCDWQSAADGMPTEHRIEAEGHTLLLTHGHLFDVKSGCGRLAEYAACIGADVVLFGHTHQPFQMVLPAGHRLGETLLSRPMYLLNPGSIGRWECSFGTLHLERETVLFSHGSTAEERMQ